MQFGILARLILGNVVLLIIAANMGMYAIVELGRVSDVTKAIITVDRALGGLDRDLTDALMSETRYEKRYLILRDHALLDGFWKAEGAFEYALGEARRLDIPSDARNALNSAAASQQTYVRLFGEEAEFLKKGAAYPQSWYAGEKERAVSDAFEQLGRLRLMGQAIMSDKLKRLGDAGDRARTLGMLVGVATLLVGLVLSVLITRSITRPLSTLREKTNDVADGIFGAELRISSPPEIGALSRAFNTMCCKLKQVDKMKCDFFSMMSHELRTPLTSIKEGTNLFLEGRAGAVTEQQKRVLAIISEESNRLIDLVNSILDLSKIEAGMAAFHFTAAGMAPLIAKAAEEVGPLAESKRIRVHTETGELPGLSLDVDRMLQVLRNLIGNALKFTPPGGMVTITARRAQNSVLVSVSDTGPGIPKEHHEGIFDKFRQAPCCDRQLGTGLGLAIVKEIIQVHGGTVWVQSEMGSGSTFLFQLPA